MTDPQAVAQNVIDVVYPLAPAQQPRDGAGTVIAQSSDQNRIDALMSTWTRSFSTEKTAACASCYWDDAKGNATMLRSIVATRSNQGQWFDNVDYVAMNLAYPGPTTSNNDRESIESSINSSCLTSLFRDCRVFC